MDYTAYRGVESAVNTRELFCIYLHSGFDKHCNILHSFVHTTTNLPDRLFAVTCTLSDVTLTKSMYMRIVSPSFSSPSLESRINCQRQTH
jgi:hypothetical protein